MRIICSREYNNSIVQIIEWQRFKNLKTRYYYIVETTDKDNFDNVHFVSLKSALNLFNKLINNEEVDHVS